MAKRVFLIVLDSVGIGEEPDAADYGDVGSNTLRTCWRSGNLHVPNLQKLGLFNIEGVGCGEAVSAPIGSFARMQESSAGKDRTLGDCGADLKKADADLSRRLPAGDYLGV